MTTFKDRLKQEILQDSPSTVLFQLKENIDDAEILKEIYSHIDFKDDKSFFKSLKKFLINYGNKTSLGNPKEMVEQIKKAEISEANAYERALQSIIMAIKRPAFLIRDDGIDLPAETEWEKRINLYENKISNTILSVGRIEIVGHPDYPYVGTGWLLKNTNIIVTNRHVAIKFATIRGSRYKIKRNSNGEPLDVKIDFKEEHDVNEEREFEIEKILYIAENNEPDLALLRVQDKNDINQKLPEGLEVSQFPVQPHDKVYILGYPAQNTTQKVKLYDFIFKGISEVKRLSPGEIFPSSAANYIYEHDCSTWYGNSGSPVINFETGKVVGIHYAGAHHYFGGVLTNWAVNSTYLLRLIEELNIPYHP